MHKIIFSLTLLFFSILSCNAFGDEKDSLAIVFQDISEIRVEKNNWYKAYTGTIPKRDELSYLLEIKEPVLSSVWLSNTFGDTQITLRQNTSKKEPLGFHTLLSINMRHGAALIELKSDGCNLLTKDNMFIMQLNPSQRLALSMWPKTDSNLQSDAMYFSECDSDESR